MVITMADLSDSLDRGAFPDRILIIRLSAIGDVVFSSPLVDALKEVYQGADIFWLAESPVVPLLEHHPHLRDVIVWPRKEWGELLRSGRWLALLKEIVRFKQRLRRYQFDLVIDAQGLFKSAVLAWMTGAVRRVGFASKEPTRALLTERIEKDTGPAISSEYRAMAKHLGCQSNVFPMKVCVPPAVEVWADTFRGDTPYVAICPFTTRPQKHWPEAHWQVLAKSLVVRGWRVVVLGGPADSVSADRIFADIRVESMVGKAALLESAALVGHADLVIGVDTGLTHMGWAFKVPTIALFGSTCPYRDLGGLRGAVLYKNMTCSPCRRKPVCGGTYDCLAALYPDSVIESMAGLLRDKLASGSVVAS